MKVKVVFYLTLQIGKLTSHCESSSTSLNNSDRATFNLLSCHSEKLKKYNSYFKILGKQKHPKTIKEIIAHETIIIKSVLCERVKMFQQYLVMWILSVSCSKIYR